MKKELKKIFESLTIKIKVLIVDEKSYKKLKKIYLLDNASLRSDTRNDNDYFRFFNGFDSFLIMREYCFLESLKNHRQGEIFEKVVEYFKSNIEKKGEHNDFEAFLKFIKGGVTK